MPNDLPLNVTGADSLYALRREVENLKRHTHGENTNLDIPDGYITTDMLAPGAIPASIITGGDLSADITLSGSLTAEAEDGSRVVFDDTGIHQIDENGNVLVNMAPGSSFTAEGDFIADSMVVKGQWALAGEGEISQGATLTVADGLSKPTSSPIANVAYERYDGGLTAYLFNQRGFHHEYDGSGWFGGMVFFQYGQMYAPGGRKWDIPTILDAVGNEHTIWNPFGGVTAVWTGTRQLMISCGIEHVADETGDGAGGFRLYDWTQMSATDPSAAPGIVAQYYPEYFLMPGWFSDHRVGRCIGTNLGNQFVDVGVAIGPNTATFRRYRVDDSNIYEEGFDVTVPYVQGDGEGVAGITYGSSQAMGFPGADQMIYLLFTSIKCYAYTDLGVRIPEYDFPMSGAPRDVDTCGSSTSMDSAAGFIGFRSTIAYQAEGEPRWITKYTDQHWDATESSRWWVSSTWRDTVNGYQTAQSERTPLTMVKRAALNVTIPPYPDPASSSANAARIYIGRGETDPGRPYMDLAEELLTPNRSVLISDFDFPADLATIPPPSTSNFPLTSPGRITSADGTSWVLGGDGSSSFSDLTITNDLTIPGDLDVTGGVTVGAGLDVTGQTTLDAITASGAAVLLNGLDVTGQTTLDAVTASGAAVLQSTLDVTGASTLTGPTHVKGGLRVDPLPSDTYSNRIIDPELLDATVGTLPYSATFSTYTDRWSVVRYVGAYTAAIENGMGRLGGRALRMSVNTASSGELDLKSPHFDLVPLATYAIGGWVRKSNSGLAKTYLRLMGGVDDNLAEYTGRAPLNMTPETGCVWGPEDVSQAWTWAGTVIQVPAGIVRGAVCLINYQPPSVITNYWNGIQVLRMGPGFTGDTGTIRASSMLNSWVNYVDWTPDPESGSIYNPVEFRRVGPMVYFGGMVKSGSSLTADIFRLPYGFRPKNKRIENGQISGQGVARIDFNQDGTVQPVSGTSLSWTSLPTVSYPAAESQ